MMAAEVCYVIIYLTVSFGSDEDLSDKDSSYEEVILPKIKRVYEKGFLGQIKNWISTDDELLALEESRIAWEDAFGNSETY